MLPVRYVMLCVCDAVSLRYGVVSMSVCMYVRCGAVRCGDKIT